MEKKLVPEKNYFLIKTKTTLTKIKEIAPAEAEKLMMQISDLKLEVTGPMEFIYFDCTDDVEKEFTLEIALPVKETDVVVPQGYSIKKHKAFKCVSHIHKGELTMLYRIYEKLFSEIWNVSEKPTNQVREVYHNYTDQFSVDNITEIQIGLQ